MVVNCFFRKRGKRSERSRQLRGKGMNRENGGNLEDNNKRGQRFRETKGYSRKKRGPPHRRKFSKGARSLR